MPAPPILRFMLYHLTTTLPDEASASAIAHALVEQRLVACAHVHAPQRSLYYWQGTLCEEAEVSISAVTHASLLAAAAEAMRVHHPYAVPCIVSAPLTSHESAYDDWVRDVLGLKP